MNIFGVFAGTAAKKVQKEAAEDAAKASLLAVLADGRRHISALIDLGNEVESPRAADLITDLAFAMRAIYDDFEKDPRDIDVAHNFVAHHAPRAVQLATTYARALAGGKLSDEDRTQTEATIRSVIDVCGEFLTKCLENDSDGLEFQAASLKRLLEFQSPALVTKPQTASSTERSTA